MKLNNVLFFNKINLIHNNEIKNYFLKYFCIKNILFRIFIVLFLTIICGLMYWILRSLAINGQINLYLNYGIGFNPLLQSSISIVDGYIIKFLIPLLFLMFFLIVNNKFLMFFTYLIFINSLFLGIDKSLLIQTYYLYSRNSIVDYININNIFYTNIGDWFIFIGYFGIIIFSVVYIFKILFNKNKLISLESFSMIDRKILLKKY